MLKLQKSNYNCKENRHEFKQNGGDNKDGLTGLENLSGHAFSVAFYFHMPLNLTESHKFSKR